MLNGKGVCVIARTKCPENGNASKGKFCPCWVEVAEANKQTGEVRTRSCCSHTVLMDWMTDAVRGTWSSAAEISAMRREVRKRLNSGEKLVEIEHG